MKYVRACSLAGLLSGLAATLSIVFVGDAFGYPGSEAYRIYENFNRLMAIFIAAETGAFIAFFSQNKDAFGRIARVAAAAVLLAWMGMAAGTAAEFWLYSDLPYGVNNMRSAAFSVFSISSLIAGLALFLLGLRIVMSGQLSRSLGIFLVLYLPFDIALFAAGQSIFLAPSLVSIAVAVFTLRSGSGSAT